MEEKNKPVQLDPITHKELKKLSEENNVTMKEMTSHMVNYFKKTGINPLDVNPESSVAEIKKLKDKLISFIKTQEKEKLNPLLDELSIISKILFTKAEGILTVDEFKDTIRKLNANQQILLNKSNEESLKGVKSIVDEMEKTKKALNEIRELIDGKLGKKGLF